VAKLGKWVRQYFLFYIEHIYGPRTRLLQLPVLEPFRQLRRHFCEPVLLFLLAVRPRGDPEHAWNCLLPSGRLQSRGGVHPPLRGTGLLHSRVAARLFDLQVDRRPQKTNPGCQHHESPLQPLPTLICTIHIFTHPYHPSMNAHQTSTYPPYRSPEPHESYLFHKTKMESGHPKRITSFFKPSFVRQGKSYLAQLCQLSSETFNTLNKTESFH
jgi:hypothetical protein